MSQPKLNWRKIVFVEVDDNIPIFYIPLYEVFMKYEAIHPGYNRTQLQQPIVLFLARKWLRVSIIAAKERGWTRLEAVL